MGQFRFSGEKEMYSNKIKFMLLSLMSFKVDGVCYAGSETRQTQAQADSKVMITHDVCCSQE